MNIETGIFRRLKSKREERREKSRNELMESARKVVEFSQLLLTDSKLDSYKGRQIKVKIPKTKRGYLIIDTSGVTEKKQVEDELSIHPLKLDRKGRFVNEYDEDWIKFPLPFSGSAVARTGYIWTSGVRFNKSMIDRLSRDLEKATKVK